MNSVITVILFMNIPIPFKFDSGKIFVTNLNAANSLGLGSKKCSKHFTKVFKTLRTQYSSFLDYYSTQSSRASAKLAANVGMEPSMFACTISMS